MTPGFHSPRADRPQDDTAEYSDIPAYPSRSCRFRVEADLELVVKLGNIVREPARGLIVPINTAFSIGGAAADVMVTVEQAIRRASGTSGPPRCFDLLFPSLHLASPFFPEGKSVSFDDEPRQRVAKLGTAIMSRSLRECGLTLSEPWERIIAAFIRHQGDEASNEESVLATSIRLATLNSFAGAHRAGLDSVAMVPFATGLFGISAHRSMSIIFSALREFLKLRGRGEMRSLSVVTNVERQFDQIANAARGEFG